MDNINVVWSHGINDNLSGYSGTMSDITNMIVLEKRSNERTQNRPGQRHMIRA